MLAGRGVVKQTYKNYWCLAWPSKNKKFRYIKNVMFPKLLPMFFETMGNAVSFSLKTYGYVDSDKFPKPIRVTITAGGEFKTIKKEKL